MALEPARNPFAGGGGYPDKAFRFHSMAIGSMLSWRVSVDPLVSSFKEASEALGTEVACFLLGYIECHLILLIRGSLLIIDGKHAGRQSRVCYGVCLQGLHSKAPLHMKMPASPFTKTIGPVRTGPCMLYCHVTLHTLQAQHKMVEAFTMCKKPDVTGFKKFMIQTMTVPTSIALQAANILTQVAFLPSHSPRMSAKLPSYTYCRRWMTNPFEVSSSADTIPDLR